MNLFESSDFQWFKYSVIGTFYSCTENINYIIIVCFYCAFPIRFLLLSVCRSLGKFYYCSTCTLGL